MSDTPLLTYPRCEGLFSSSHNLRIWLLSVSLFTCGPVSLRSCDEGGCAELMSAQKRAHQRCSAFHVLKTTDEAPCCACSDFFFLQLHPLHARLLNGDTDWWLHQEALLWFRTADTAPDISAWMFFCFLFFSHRWNIFYFGGLFLDWWICLWHHVFICIWPDTCSEKKYLKMCSIIHSWKNL